MRVQGHDIVRFGAMARTNPLLWKSFVTLELQLEINWRNTPNVVHVGAIFASHPMDHERKHDECFPLYALWFLGAQNQTGPLCVLSCTERESEREKSYNNLARELLLHTKHSSRADGRTDMRIIAFVSFAGKKIMCSGCPRKVHDGGAMAIIHNSTSIKRVFLQGFSFVFLERKSNNTC